jgi:FlaA1/EpsC-like NDP-sugar epimerase
MRNRYVLFADICLIPLVAYAAFALRFALGFQLERTEFRDFVLAALIIKPTVFYFFGMYHRYWQYSSMPDLMALLVASGAAFLAMVAFVAGWMIFHPWREFSRGALMIDGLLTFLTAGALRVSIRILNESRNRKREASAATRAVLVVGAGHAGTLVVREMDRNPQLGMRPVGFLDDDPAKHGKQIYGIPVLGSVPILAAVVRKHGVDEIIIAMPTAPGSQLRSITEQCRKLGVVSRTMPGVYELLDGNVNVGRLRQVQIADLLRRSQVQPNVNTTSYVEGRTVLVTGAGGSIGSELCRRVARLRPSTLVLLGHGENSIFDIEQELRDRFPSLSLAAVIADIRDQDRVRQVFQRLRPAIVFHGAAHKHVPLMEENPEEALTNNVLGTHVVLEAVIEFGTERFVMISSDKAVSPSSIMGASKRAAEILVIDAARRSGRNFGVVRFGNVLGSRGSVIPRFEQQIQQGGPITLTHPEMKRYFMTIPEAVHLVLEAGGIGCGGELFVLKMGDPVRIADLAADLIKLSGFTLDEIPIVYTGIRTGEKIEERLWEKDAFTEPTTHPDILKVVEPRGSPAISELLKQCASVTKQTDRLVVKALLAEHLPSFVPALKADQ